MAFPEVESLILEIWPYDVLSLALGHEHGESDEHRPFLPSLDQIAWVVD